MVVENMETPVLAVAPTIPRDNSTKLVLEMRGGWDYTFAQNGNALSVDVFKIGDDYKQMKMYNDVGPILYQKI